MKSTTSYVIAEKYGALLCHDGKFRDWASFGTFPYCVKQYKTVGHALNTASKPRNRWVDATVMAIHWDRVKQADVDDFYMNSFHIIWKGVQKGYRELIADAKKGVNNDFPVTFTFPR